MSGLKRIGLTMVKPSLQVSKFLQEHDDNPDLEGSDEEVPSTGLANVVEVRIDGFNSLSDEQKRWCKKVEDCLAVKFV